MLGEELWQAARAELVELSKAEFAESEIVLSSYRFKGLGKLRRAELVELSKAEFAEALETIGAKDNFGLDPGKQANERQRETFWRALHLEELAIARGCALGRESAWRRFLAQYREQLTRAAVEMTGSVTLGEELASALYSELFGLT